MEEPLSVGPAGESENSAIAPSSSADSAITPGESPSPLASTDASSGSRASDTLGSDGSLPPESSEPEIDESVFQAWLDKQIDADPDAFHKRVTQREGYRQLYQKHADTLAKTGVAEASRQMRLESEHAAAMLENQRALNGLTSEQRDAASWSDEEARKLSGGDLTRKGYTEDARGFRKLVNDVADFHDNRANAPTRNLIAFESATTQVDGLVKLLAESPDWKVTRGDWDKFTKDGVAEYGQTPMAYAAAQFKALGHQREIDRAHDRAEIRTELEAKMRDEVAARTHGAPEPGLATVGRSNGTSGLQAAVNKAVDGDMSPADWHNYDLGIAAGLHPQRN